MSEPAIEEGRTCTIDMDLVNRIALWMRNCSATQLPVP
jgi:hypothetical protein